jgi:GntR family transcriptional repressor for pyruvate dehydrogenase complex
MPVKPVERQSLAKSVMEQLIAYIRSDGLESGDALPNQNELARQLAVSRPILREALQGLETLGIIEIRAGSGCYVQDPNAGVNPETLLESYTHESALAVLETRMVVEVELAGLAATRATAEDLERMSTILKRLKRAAARGQLSAPITSDFHQAISRAGHNMIMYRMTQLLSRPRLEQGIRVEAAFPDVTSNEYESHRVLFEAISSGNPDTARKAMREHLELAHGWESMLTSRNAGETPDRHDTPPSPDRK